MNKKQTVLDDIPGFESWLAVARTSQLFQRHLAHALDPLELEIAHYDVLANVARDEGLSQQVLARRLLVAKSNVSALLSVLERKSLIVRIKPAADARVRLVSLTSEGRRITLQAMAAHARIVKTIMAAITAEEQIVTQRVMVKITRALQPEQVLCTQAVA